MPYNFFMYLEQVKKYFSLFIFTVVALAAAANPSAKKEPADLNVDFTFSPDTVHAGAFIRFTVTSNANSFWLTCDWNWGDGTTWENGGGESYSHRFLSAGSYIVKLVGSASSFEDDSVTKMITVLPASIIIADFTYSPDTIYSGTPVTITDMSYVENGYINSTAISLDGGIVYSPAGVISFGTPGVYNVTYKIGTNLSEDGYTTKTITVLPGGQATLKVCPGITKKLFSYAGTEPYQWQLSTDSGDSFNNIMDNPPYTGSNTFYLTIDPLPSSHYGYIYRCVSSTDTSTAYKIEFSNSFTSTSNTNWENPSSWSCSSLPDINTDVIINGLNVLVNSNAFCRTLRLLNGANVTVAAGYTLTITH
jgi:plastocyanin